MMLEAASILVNFGHGIQNPDDPDYIIQRGTPNGDDHASNLDEGQAPTTMMATRHASSSSSTTSVEVEDDDHRIWSAWFSAAARERRRCTGNRACVDGMKYSDDGMDLSDGRDKDGSPTLVTPPSSTPSNSPSRDPAGRRVAAAVGDAPVEGGAPEGGWRGRLPRRADSPVTASLKKAILRAEHFSSACAGGTLLELARARRSGREGFAVV
ncbi:hypothetical protein HK405_003011 [Cladochytrium tenue]|nr:hypothetical protein HK405_003011 [Cladochytrium tenue]